MSLGQNMYIQNPSVEIWVIKRKTDVRKSWSLEKSQQWTERPEREQSLIVCFQTHSYEYTHTLDDYLRAAKTKYHRLGDLNSRNCLPLGPEAGSSRSKCSRGQFNLRPHSLAYKQPSFCHAHVLCVPPPRCPLLMKMPITSS